MATVFTVTVSTRDWDDVLAGWRCPALDIPGAEIDALFVNGSKMDDGWYERLNGQPFVRWMRPEIPELATISVRLTKELSTQDQTARWKNIAIILSFLSPILVALITGYFTIIRTSVPAGNANAQPSSVVFKDPPATLNIQNIETPPDWLNLILKYYRRVASDEQRSKPDLNVSVGALEVGLDDPTNSFTWLLTTDSDFEIAGYGFKEDEHGFLEPLTERAEKQSISFEVPKCSKNDKLIVVVYVKWSTQFMARNIQETFHSFVKK
jgi:hypothetical protein